MQRFLNIVYRNGMIPTTNKPNAGTQNATNAIGHILKNSFTDTVFETAIFKSDISDHFHICFLIPSSTKQTNNTRLPLYIT